MDDRNKTSKILDDVAKIAGDALGALGSLKTEVESSFRSKLEGYLGKMDLVSREEYQVLESMVCKLRLEQEELIKRITELEKANAN